MSTDARQPTALITGSGARFAQRLDQALRDLGWRVETVLQPDPLALPPTAAIHVEGSVDDSGLQQHVADADATIFLGGVGSISSVVDDAKALDAVLGSAKPGSTLVAITSLAVFGDTGSETVIEGDRPAGPSEFDPARAVETRVVTADDWLRTVVIRPGLVYGDGGGDVMRQAVDLARTSGTSRYFGEPADVIPLVHEDDLLALLVHTLENPAARGVYHAASDETSVLQIAEMVAEIAGVASTAPWDEEAMTELLGISAHVPRVNVTTQGRSSRAVEQLGWTAQAMSLRDAMSEGLGE